MKAMKEYCQEYQGQFELVGTYLAPVETMSFTSEVQRLKDQVAIHKYSAGKKHLVWVSGWEPLLK